MVTMSKRILPLAAVWLVAVAIVGGSAPQPGQANAPVRPAAGTPAPQTPARAAAPAPPTAGVVADAALVKQYCATCHSERMKAGGLVLDGLDVTSVAGHAEEWEKVVRKIRTGMMPPSNAPRPPRATLDGFAASLEARLDRAADSRAPLETPALHRLNRVEYSNAIRDLLDLTVDVTPLLPADGSTEGFDNLAEALGVSPSHIQGYVSAAMKISRLAVGDRSMAPSMVTYPTPAGLAQDRHIDGLPIGTRGGRLIRHTFPLDAEYEFTIGGGRGGGGGGTDITLDGEKLNLQNTGKFRIPVTAGPHTIGVAVLDRQRGAGVDDAYSDFRSPNGGFTTGGGVQNVAIMGPFNAKGPGDTPSRRRIFVCRPSAPADEETPASANASARSRRSSQEIQASEDGCARTILTTLARRAYRGTVTAADLDTLMAFYRQGRKDGDFENGIQSALARVLVAPRFLYRTEEEPANVPADGVYRISDFELASRLSFFLWSSIPDDQLLDLAAKGRLRDVATLREQVRRMIADPKSDALISNFAGQWLYLRELASLQTEAPGFNENLRRAFRRETEMVFAAIVREDRAILDLLDADYTFVDERLAEHYGIENVRGSHFRRVTLPAGSPRRGLLGHGSMLTVTSVATRTSPVMRGKWILENLLGAPPPEPPPGVEVNLDQPEAAKTTTLRQRLEMHRASPVCASCHNIMDPMGLALENFDLIGRWRDTDGPAKVDATGRLADGTPLAGAADLRQAMLSRSEAFVTTAAEKLMIYGLGRPVHHYDMPLVRTIVRRAGREGNRFSALVLGLVESDAFQKRIKKAS
jgi:mono/diheme cytochrome c family protein